MAARLLRITFLLLMAALFLVACSANKDLVVSPSLETICDRTMQVGNSVTSLSQVSVILPFDISSVIVSDTQIDLMSDNQRIGGIITLECDPVIFDDVLGFVSSLEIIVNKALDQQGLPPAEWVMNSSSVYGLHAYSRGSETSEYMTHVLRGNHATYAVWLDKKQVSDSLEEEIMTSIHSDDINDSLNRISSEDFMDAISKEMDKHTYKFAVTLPPQLLMEQIENDGAVFLQNGNIVGGYKIIHFEKGILPKVHENLETVLQRIVDALSSQIDLDEYHGEIIADMPITIRFTNQEMENTHYILSYGQIGTQYDLWLDSKVLGDEVIHDIIQHVALIEVSGPK